MSQDQIVNELKQVKPELFREFLEYLQRSEYIRLQQEHRRARQNYFDTHVRYQPRGAWRDFERHEKKRKEIDEKYQTLLEDLPGTYETWYDLWKPPDTHEPPPPGGVAT